MLVRLLTTPDPAGRAARYAEVLDPAAAARVASAEVEVLVASGLGTIVDAVAAVLTGVGAVAERGRSDELVVAASRAQLVAATESSEDEAAAGVRSLLEAYDRCATAPAALRWRDRTIALDGAAQVMGIVNVTPDSFYDRAAGLDDVVARARAIAEAGGALVDIGGQSYAHWNPRIAADEERARVVPAVEAIAAAGIDLALSIDTFKASVADGALAAAGSPIRRFPASSRATTRGSWSCTSRAS